MKDLFKNKMFISFGIVLIIIIILSIVLIIVKNKNNNELSDNKDNNKIEDVETSEVEIIYDSLSNVDCNKELVWEFKNDIIKASDIDNSTKIKMVLARIKNEEKLNEELNEKTFKEYSALVFGKSSEIELKDVSFSGKKYSIGNSTVITEGEACLDSNYKSMLFGYTYSGEILSVDVAVGIVEGNTVYDLDNNELGKYTTNDELNELLRDSIIYRYGFKKENNNYYLDNISKVVTVKLGD